MKNLFPQTSLGILKTDTTNFLQLIKYSHPKAEMQLMKGTF